MDTVYISATDLKNNVSEVINNVYYKKITTIVERHGNPLVKIMPADTLPLSEKKKAALKKFFGSIPDFPDVTKFRRSRKKWPVL